MDFYVSHRYKSWSAYNRRDHEFLWISNLCVALKMTLSLPLTFVTWWQPRLTFLEKSYVFCSFDQHVAILVWMFNVLKPFLLRIVSYSWCYLRVLLINPYFCIMKQSSEGTFFMGLQSICSLYYSYVDFNINFWPGWTG